MTGDPRPRVEGPDLWEAEAWHAFIGPGADGVLCYVVVGPTRRAPADRMSPVMKGATGPLVYARSFAHEPTDAERDALFDELEADVESGAFVFRLSGER